MQPNEIPVAYQVFTIILGTFTFLGGLLFGFFIGRWSCKRDIAEMRRLKRSDHFHFERKAKS